MHCFSSFLKLTTLIKGGINMSEQPVHQQNSIEEIAETQQQNIYQKGEIHYEKIKICGQFCSDILRVRL